MMLKVLENTVIQANVCLFQKIFFKNFFKFFSSFLQTKQIPLRFLIKGIVVILAFGSRHLGQF